MFAEVFLVVLELRKLFTEICNLVVSRAQDFRDGSGVKVEEFGVHRTLVAALGVFEWKCAVDVLVGGQFVEVEFAGADEVGVGDCAVLDCDFDELCVRSASECKGIVPASVLQSARCAGFVVEQRHDCNGILSVLDVR